LNWVRALAYPLLGPAVGAAPPILLLLAAMAAHECSRTSWADLDHILIFFIEILPMLLGFGLLGGYVLGLAPAVASALAHLLAARLDLRRGVAAMLVIGTGTVAGGIVAATFVAITKDPDLASVALAVPVCAALAAGALFLWLRPPAEPMGRKSAWL
jgi:hypothetical protein